MTKKTTKSKKTKSPYSKRYVLLSLTAVALSFLYLGSRPFSLIERDGSLDPTPDQANVEPSENEPIETEEKDTIKPNHSMRPFTEDTKLYVPVISTALDQYNSWQDDPARVSDAAAVKILADTPTGVWLSTNDAVDTTRFDKHLASAAETNSVPIFVYYNIPRLGCQSGGASSLEDYKNWIDIVTGKIAELDEAIVILEPDAVPLFDCLNAQEQEDRYAALSHAVTTLRSANIYTYIDAGHSNWISASVIASRINKIEESEHVGFSLNVSNFGTTEDNTEFGNELSAALGNDARFVIDTSRNGLGPNEADDWCNPPGRSVGPSSQFLSDDSLVDAHLWIKVPGESDAACNGGPAEGLWWAEYGVALIENRP